MSHSTIGAIAAVLLLNFFGNFLGLWKGLLPILSWPTLATVVVGMVLGGLVGAILAGAQKHDGAE